MKPTGFVCDAEIRSNTFRNPVYFHMIIIQFDFMNVKEEDLFESAVKVDQIHTIAREVCLKDKYSLPEKLTVAL